MSYEAWTTDELIRLRDSGRLLDRQSRVHPVIARTATSVTSVTSATSEGVRIVLRSVAIRRRLWRLWFRHDTARRRSSTDFGLCA